MQKVDAGISKPSIDGSLPEELRKRPGSMSKREYECWNNHLQPELAKEGIAFKHIGHRKRNLYGCGQRSLPSPYALGH